MQKGHRIVPGHDHDAGVGLADDPPNSITLVAAQGWAQLPDQLAECYLQSVTIGDLPSCFIDGRRPASRVGDPSRMNGNGILLVLQVGATVTECGAIAEILYASANDGSDVKFNTGGLLRTDLHTRTLASRRGRPTRRQGPSYGCPWTMVVTR